MKNGKVIMPSSRVVAAARLIKKLKGQCGRCPYYKGYKCATKKELASLAYMSGAN